MRPGLALLAGAATSFCLTLGSPSSAAESGVPVGLRLSPTFDIRQVVTRDSFEDGTVTYSEAVVGVGGTVNTHRVKASINYEYSRRFAEQGHSDRKQNHSLFARADANLIEDRLTVTSGAFAALLNRDFRGFVSYSLDQNNSNLTQTYSAYIQPSYHQPLNSFAEFDVSYRLGYTGTSDKEPTGGVIGGLPGSASSDVPTANAGNSTNQRLQARLGNRQASERFRWDFASTTTFEDVGRLDQRYRSYDNRFEVQYAVRRGVNLIANVGYERTTDTQSEVLRDANGLPIPDAGGGFQIDPTGSRRQIYSQKGLSYEGGVHLQPTRRTNLTVRAGRRFGRFTVNGDARYQVTPRLVLSGQITEGIDSFGRLLTRDIEGTSVASIVNTSDTLGLGGCVFGTDPGTGRCLFDATQSITDALFRNRSGQAIAEYRRGRSSVTLAVIYSERKFLDTQQLQRAGTPAVDGGFTGGADKTFSANAQFSQAFRGRQTASLGLFFNRYDFALSNQRSDKYVGGTGSYTVDLARRLAVFVNGTASIRHSDVAPTGKNATASVGLRLRF